MGSEYNISQKQRYDISMSKRTRKPLNARDANRNDRVMRGDHAANGGGIERFPERGGGEENNGHKSLKQLITGDGKSTVVIKSSGGDGDGDGEGSKGRSSLGQHFTEEEKNLKLITTQHTEGLQGRKLKKIVSRYAKVLSHLIKVKKESNNKPVLRLTM